MNFDILKYLFLGLLICATQASVARADSPGTLAPPAYSPAEIPLNTAPLFQSPSRLEFQLQAPLAELFAHRGAGGHAIGKDATVNGTITIANEVVPVEIRMRGFSSLRTCRFPKLTLKFSKTLPATSLFAGLGKLDVGTHCDAPDEKSKRFFAAMNFNGREALLYNWLKILEIPAYAAREAKITYIDTSVATPVITPVPTVTASAILIENLSSFLARSQGVEIRAINDRQHKGAKPSPDWRAVYHDLKEHAEIDRVQLSMINLFTGFVNDSDHRLGLDEIWNFKLIELKDGRWMPIPLDFNLAWLARGGTATVLTVSPDFFLARPAAERLAHLVQLKSKLSEMRAAISNLVDDPAGVTAFTQTLDAQPKNIDALITAAEEELKVQP